MGSYAEVPAGPPAATTWRSARMRLMLWKLRQPRFAPGDTRGGSTLYREYGLWVVRPNKGLRSQQWLTPPLHAARNEDAALDWMAEQIEY
jgi:hypothetical protein